METAIINYETASRLFSGGSKVRINGSGTLQPLNKVAGVLARAMHTLVDRVNAMDIDDRNGITVDMDKKNDTLRVVLYNPANDCGVEFRAAPMGDTHYTAILAYGKNGIEPHYLPGAPKNGEPPKGLPDLNNGQRVFRARSKSYANFLQGYLFA